MISREALRQIGRRAGLHLYQQEKDYLIKLFLYNYFRRFDDAVFKGGTCLRYLYGTERFSEDIDFNITVPPSEFGEQVEKTLKEICLTGITNGFIKKEMFEESYTCEIWFHGPLYEGAEQTRNKFRIDAGERGGCIKTPRWELIRSEYPETREQFLVQTMDEGELLIEKVLTMFRRKKGRDLYDVWFLLKRGMSIDAELLDQKSGGPPRSTGFPTKKEYERDMEKLTTRMTPYEQVIRDVSAVLGTK